MPTEVLSRRVTGDDLEVRNAERSAYRAIQTRAVVIQLATRSEITPEQAMVLAGRDTGCLAPDTFFLGRRPSLSDPQAFERSWPRIPRCEARRRPAPRRRSRGWRVLRDLVRWLLSPRAW